MWRPVHLLGCLLVVVMLLASTAQAQNDSSVEDIALGSYPPCALNCLLEPASESDCELLDIECQCSGAGSILDKASACIVRSCSSTDSLIARNATQTLCKQPIRDDSNKVYAICVAFSIAAALFVIQRFAVKFLAHNLEVGLDDWIILLAAVVQAPAVGLICEPGIANGLGKDVWTLEPSQITNFGYYLYVFTAIYFTNLAIVKLAFLFFYLRVFPKPVVRKMLWSTIIFVMVWGLVFMFVSVFQCKPISFTWNRWDGEHDGSCVNTSAMAWANGAMSIALDLWMIGIPLSQLRGLNLDWKKKFGVGAMFCVGLFVTIISIVRLQSLITHPWDDPNATWVKMEIALWSTVEINVGIICACLPSLRSLVVRIFPSMNVWASDGGHGGSRGRDFTERNLGFGTTSRSIAEKHPDFPMPTRPGAIALHRTYAVEFGRRLSEETEEATLVPLGSLDGFSTTERSPSRSDKLRKQYS